MIKKSASIGFIITASLAVSLAGRSLQPLAAEVTDLLGRDWADCTLERAIDVSPPQATESEVWAPLTYGQNCSNVRVLRLVRTVIAGHCRECLRLEYTYDDSANEYKLTAVIVDDTTSSRRAAVATIERLLRASGASRPVRFHFGEHGTFATSDSWITPGEARSVDATIKRQPFGWSIHFDHRRTRMSS